ncbi:MAG: hypothetical protein JSR77_17425 [Planctomycetes bacterium]|nr:hypothetical protein [Planctomycetota bacterium]
MRTSFAGAFIVVVSIAGTAGAQVAAYARDVHAAWTALYAGDAAKAKTLLESCPENLRRWEWRQAMAFASAGEKPKAKAPPPSGSTVTISFHPSLPRLAFGAPDGKVYIWDVRENASIGSAWAVAGCTNHAEPAAKCGVLHAIFSGDGRTLVTGADDGTVCVFDAATLKPRIEMRELPGTIMSMSVNADATLVCAVTTGGNAVVWDSKEGKQLANLGKTLTFGQPVTFLPDGVHVVTGGLSGADLYIARTGAKERHVCSTAPYSMALAVSPDSSRIAIGCRGSVTKAAFVFGMDKGEQIWLLPHPKGISGVAFTEDGARLLTACVDQRVRVFDTSNGQELAWLEAPSATRTVAMSADATCVAWSSAAGVEFVTTEAAPAAH